MKVSTRYYPHPVLSNFSDDITGSSFEVEADIKPTNGVNYTFNIKCELKNEDLWNYIDQGLACFTIHVECSSTRMREVFKSYTNEFSFDILADRLNGKVEVCAFILADKDIHNYFNSMFHDDYSGISFEVVKGDVLAVATGKRFDADKEKDDLKSIPSIFTVGKNEEHDAPPLDIDFGQTNKIVLKLSKKNFEYYGQLAKNSDLGKIVASMILVPALVALLEQIKSSDFDYEQYESCKWFKSIERRLMSLGIDIKENNDFQDSTIVVAQKIVGDPLDGSLKDLFNYLDRE